jgi:transposase InsO family protein
LLGQWLVTEQPGELCFRAQFYLSNSVPRSCSFATLLIPLYPRVIWFEYCLYYGSFCQFLLCSTHLLESSTSLCLRYLVSLYAGFVMDCSSRSYLTFDTMDFYFGQYVLCWSSFSCFNFSLTHVFSFFLKLVVLAVLQVVILLLHLLKFFVSLKMSEVSKEKRDRSAERLELDKVRVSLIEVTSKSDEVRVDKHLGQRSGNELKRINKIYYRGEVEDFVPGEDLVLVSENHSSRDLEVARAFGAYKTVDKRVKPVSGTFPQEALVKRSFPHNPLADLPELSAHPSEFKPSPRISAERLEILGINSSGFLWPEEEKLFIQVMMLNEKTLAFEETDRGTLREDYFSPYIMPTIPHIPWEEKNIPIPPGIKSKVIELLKSKMDAGVYEHCQSAYRSKWFCVLKKSGKLRLVHDLQALNAVSVRDAGGPPILDDFVEPFAGHQCYTVFDLFWGFDARRVHPDSRDLTAFSTPLGLLRLTSMPMGYTNSPAEFQKCMTFILRDEIPDVANIFIDDLPIKGPATIYPDANGEPETLAENPGIRRFIWEHAQDVNRIMHRIGKAGATFSATKCQICLPEVLIVGQRCTPEGRLPDNDKVEKILKWPLPESVSQVRGFLGLCGTVRIWINGYSQLNRKMTELYHKDEEFIWTPERIKAFEELKRAVASAPALRSVDYSSELPVILAVDTSQLAVGIVLLQIDEKGKRRPARYGSIPLNPVEQRYSQPKLELYGLYRALRAFRLYLIGVKNLIVEVDAKYIKGMLNAPDLQPNAAMNRWIQGIMLFDFALKHIPGRSHQAADALSRRALGEKEEVEEHDDSWLDDIALYAGVMESPPHVFPHHGEVQTQSHYPVRDLPSGSFPATARLDGQLREIFRFLTTLEAPQSESIQDQKRFIKKATQYFVKGGKMWKRRQSRPPLLVIFDSDRRIAILTEAHEGLGHRGEQSVFETIRERYFWPHLRMDVKHHVRSCHQCQIRSTARMKIPVTVSTPATIFTKIYVDVMDMTESSHGYKYIVCARDDLSRASEGRALRKNDSISLMRFFWEQIYCRYGAIGEVVTDNGPEVKGAFAELLRRLNIPQVRISAYNKQANGVVERGHFIIREAIMKSVKNHKDWPTKVPIAFLADRVSVSKVTGFSAYFLLHGVHPVLPFDLADVTFLVDGFSSGMTSEQLLALRIRQLEKRQEDLAAAALALRKARFKSKEEFEWKYRKRMKREFYKSGQLVLVRNSEQEMRLNRKTKPRYLGPYEVCRRTKGGSYVLKELDGSILKEGVAAFRLLPYVSRHDKSLLKQIAREVAEESEESNTDNDWNSSTSNDEFEEEDD